MQVDHDVRRVRCTDTALPLGSCAMLPTSSPLKGTDQPGFLAPTSEKDI